MGDGWQRAVTAAARTRSDPRLTLEMGVFLKRLERAKEPMTRGQIGCVVSKEDEYARRACKRFGYAAQRMREDGKWGWQITADGRKALEGAFGFRSGRGEPSALPCNAGELER